MALAELGNEIASWCCCVEESRRWRERKLVSGLALVWWQHASCLMKEEVRETKGASYAFRGEKQKVTRGAVFFEMSKG